MRAKQGETSPVIEGETAFYVFRLDSIAEAGTPTLAADSRHRGAAGARGEEGREGQGDREGARRAGSRPARRWPTASKAMGLSNREFPPFARVSPPISNAKLVGAIFGLRDGQTSDVIETDEGLYVVQMIQRLPADSLAFVSEQGPAARRGDPGDAPGADSPVPRLAPRGGEGRRRATRSSRPTRRSRPRRRSQQPGATAPLIEPPR